MDIKRLHQGAQPQDSFFDDMSQTLANVAAALLEDRASVVPALRLITTSDVMATAAVEGDALGLDADRRRGAERIGGVVAGKCLVAEDRSRASIILADDVHRSDDALGKLLAVNHVAHELGHLVYGSIRASAIGVRPNVHLPWDIAGMIAVTAAEEYRVDLLAGLVTQAALNPTDDDGNTIGLSSIILPTWVAGLSDALDEMSPGLEETIWSYRVGILRLEDMWNEVARVSEGIAIYLAHTEAHNSADELVAATVDHRASSLLEPFWRPWFEHLQATAFLPEAEDWADDRARLIGIGQTGFAETWRRIGIVATPYEDTFYLAVDEPAFD